MFIEHPTAYLAVLSTKNVQHKIEQTGWVGVKGECYNSMAYAGFIEPRGMKIGCGILETNFMVYMVWQ
jgi:hypothetical protein